MPRIPLVFAAIALGFAPTARAETRSYDLRDFSKLEVSALYDVEYVQSSTYSITIDSPTDDFARIIVEKRGDTLNIRRPNNFRSYGERPADRVRIFAPTLDQIDMHAAMRFRADKLKARSVEFNLHAAVEIDVRNVDIDTLAINSHAGVQAKFAGRCDDLRISSHAGSVIDAQKLKCAHVEIGAYTGVTASVYASESLDAEAHLGSTIRVAGHPRTLKRTARMSSNIELLD